MVKSASVIRLETAVRGQPRVLRAYFECRFGQLHVTHALPAGGGFDEATPVLCVPGQAGLGRVYAALLPLLGRDRALYALDLPGCGMSDGVPQLAGDAAVAGAAVDALQDLCVTLRLRRVNLLTEGVGLGTGLLFRARCPQLAGRLVHLGDASEQLPESARLAGAQWLAARLAADGTIDTGAARLLLQPLLEALGSD